MPRIKAKKDDKTEPLPLVPVRYFIDQDKSLDWYIVEDSRRDDWDKWLSLENGSGVPSFARMIGISGVNGVSAISALPANDPRARSRPRDVTFEMPSGIP